MTDLVNSIDSWPKAIVAIILILAVAGVIRAYFKRF